MNDFSTAVLSKYFFIRSFEIVINIVVVIAAILIVIGAGAALMGGGAMAQQTGMPSAVTALMILVGGFIYLVMVAGFMYLGLGIYQNTKRTAELLENR